MTMFEIVLLCLISMILIGYSDAAIRLVRIERKLNLLIRHNGIDPLQGVPLSERVKQIADDPARKIEAIKLHRQETGASLNEAKDAVEAYVNSK